MSTVFCTAVVISALLCHVYDYESFQDEAGSDSEGAWKPEEKKSPEAFVPRGTKGTKRAYELALKAFQDLAREVSFTNNIVSHVGV